MVSFWSLFATEILTITSNIHFYLHLYFTYISTFHFYLHMYFTFDPHFLLYTSHFSVFLFYRCRLTRTPRSHRLPLPRPIIALGTCTFTKITRIWHPRPKIALGRAFATYCSATTLHPPLILLLLCLFFFKFFLVFFLKLFLFLFCWRLLFCVLRFFNAILYITQLFYFQ